MKTIVRLSLLKWTLFALSSGLLLEACATVPPDVPVCEALEPHLGRDEATGHVILKPSPACMDAIGETACGHCTTIMTGKEFFIGELPANQHGGRPWSEIRDASVIVPATESYAPLATYIINSCKKMNCSDDVTRFKVKLDSLNGLSSVLK